MFPNPADVLSNLVKLGGDLINDFNPFVTGSFLYWGASTDYTVPSLIGGTIQDLTGIPNQFTFPADHPLGAEPPWGLTAGPSSLLTGLPQGFEYLAQGLLGYLNPSIYLEAVSNDLSLLGNPTALLGNIPLLGLLGDPTELRSSFDPAGLLSSFDPAGLLSSFDATGLLSSFDAAGLLSSLDDAAGLLSSFGPAGLLGSLGPDVAMNLSSLLPNAGADLAAMLGQEFAVNLGSLIPQLLTSFIPF